MDAFDGRLLATAIIALLVVAYVGCTEQKEQTTEQPKPDDDSKPLAEKLTIDIQSMSNRIPPQIAYFIPDSALNQTNFGLFNSNTPTVVSILPRNNNNNNNNNNSNNNNSNRDNDSDRNNNRDRNNRDRNNRDRNNRDRNNRDRNNRDRRNRDRDRRRRRNRNRDRSDVSDYLDDDDDGDYSDSASVQDSRDTDLFMAPQQTVRYVTAAMDPARIQSFVDEDATTSYQNLDHQIDFMQIPDKKPDFSRFEEMERAARKSLQVKQAHRVQRPQSTELDYVYANAVPSIRGKIATLKKFHRHEYASTAPIDDGFDDGVADGGADRFGSNDDRYGLSGDHGYAEHGYSETNWSHKKPTKHKKARKNRTKLPSAYYATKHKLSQPVSSAEMESASDGTDVRASSERYRYAANGGQHPIDDEPFDMDGVQGVQTLQQFAESGNAKPHKRRRPKKGFTILLTKVMKQPAPYRVHRMDTANAQKNEQLQLQLQQQREEEEEEEEEEELREKNAENADTGAVLSFVPTRLLTSVRNTVKVKHLPRSQQSPSIRSKLIETGSHLVYTEDGYEDKEYDHGDEDRSLEYGTRRRQRRDARNAQEKTGNAQEKTGNAQEKTKNVKDLRGQALFDHLDDLIRNVSDYLDSSEIIPRTKYPLYNDTKDEVPEESPIRYSEYARPVVDNDHAHELYASLPKNCTAFADDIDVSVAASDSNTKKRLGTLQEQLQCEKVKLFGEEPFDNPLFKEENITQPNGDQVLREANAEADRIGSISSVYDDVMDNIKFNENQRIFSDFGVRENFEIGTIKMHDDVNAEGTLATTSERPTYKSKRRKASPTTTTTTTEGTQIEEAQNLFEANDDVHPFNDPAQVPILDISRFIPTARYPTINYNDETDFVPIVSPYTSYYQYRRPTTAAEATTAPKYETTTPRSAPTYGQPQPQLESSLQQEVKAQSGYLQQEEEQQPVQTYSQLQPAQTYSQLQPAQPQLYSKHRVQLHHKSPHQPQPHHHAVPLYTFSSSNVVNSVQRPNFYNAPNQMTAYAVPNSVYKAQPNNLLTYKNRRPIQLVRVQKATV